VALSIDTYKSDTMQAALDAGVDCVNDIWGLRQAGAAKVVSDHSECGVVLMHMQRDPQTMQFDPHYDDVIAQVSVFLVERVNTLSKLGISVDRIALDPGFGFGKSLEHNLTMLSQFERFTQLGFPVLAGISRKSMLGKLTGREPDDRLAASIAAVIMAADRGARIVRVHDVAETIDALKLWEAVL